MRITREMMLKVASETVARQARASRDLLGAYLCGSLLDEEYLLGGAGDIDLVYLHTEPVYIRREIVRLTDEVHLDIAHYHHKDYREPRSLREHPWLGPTLNSCRILYDPQHFLDFTQASVRGQYDRADHVYKRASHELDQARAIWLSYQTPPASPQPDDLLAYLHALGYAANAVAVVSGPPLTDRRLLLQFPARTDALGKPGLYAGLLGLLGASNLPEAGIAAWLPGWLASYQALPPEELPARLHPARKAYYANALSAVSAGPQPEAGLWLLLRTWTMAAGFYPADSPERRTWHQACDQLDLVGPAFAERLQALDAYLDVVDEALETWARANGGLDE